MQQLYWQLDLEHEICSIQQQPLIIDSGARNLLHTANPTHINQLGARNLFHTAKPLSVFRTSLNKATWRKQGSIQQPTPIIVLLLRNLKKVAYSKTHWTKLFTSVCVWLCLYMCICSLLLLRHSLERSFFFMKKSEQQSFFASLSTAHSRPYSESHRGRRQRGLYSERRCT